MGDLYGIQCTALDTGRVWVVQRGHKTGPFETLAEAEKSAKKKNRIAKEKGVPMQFAAVPCDVDPWGLPIAKAVQAPGPEGDTKR